MVYFVHVMKSLIKTVVLAFIICSNLNMNLFAGAMPRNLDALSASNNYDGEMAQAGRYLDTNVHQEDRVELRKLLDVLLRLQDKERKEALVGDEDGSYDEEKLGPVENRDLAKSLLNSIRRHRFGGAQSEAKRASINAIPMGFGK